MVRVHPQILAKQKLPATVVSDRIWKERYEDIGAFERYLSRNGTVIRKFFLNVSKEEQRQRFLARLDQPEKNWKFAAADVEERQHWDEYMKAYEKMIEATTSEEAPWFVIPADHKWFTRLVVAAAIGRPCRRSTSTSPRSRGPAPGGSRRARCWRAARA